ELGAQVLPEREPAPRVGEVLVDRPRRDPGPLVDAVITVGRHRPQLAVWVEARGPGRVVQPPVMVPVLRPQVEEVIAVDVFARVELPVVVEVLVHVVEVAVAVDVLPQSSLAAARHTSTPRRSEARRVGTPRRP